MTRLVVLLAVCIAAAVFVVGPRSAPSPFYQRQADRLLAGQPGVNGDWLSSGYTVVRAAGTAFLGRAWGPELIQAVAYVLMVWCAATTPRLLGATSRWAGVAAAALVGLHPYLLLNVAREIDGAVVVPLLALLVRLWAGTPAGGGPIWRAVVLGLTTGGLLATRGNMAVIGLLVLSRVVASGGEVSWRRRLGWYACYSAVALGVLVAGNYWVGGRVFLLPRYGAYTTFIGNNPYSEEAFLGSLNGEPSYLPAVAAAAAEGRSPPGGHLGLDLENYSDQTPDFDRYLMAEAKRFVAERPAEALRLVGVRFVTMFRPDLRMVNRSSTGAGSWLLTAVQVGVALVPPVWLAVRLLAIFRRRRVGWALPALVGLYLLPFLLTNADPRFRLPSDFLMLLDLSVITVRQSHPHCATQANPC